MVECEYGRERESNMQDYSFNRYMVECEYLETIEMKISFPVLIDTWWNVNHQRM